MAVGWWSLVVCWLFAATSNTFTMHHDAPFDVARILMDDAQVEMTNSGE